MMRQNHQLVDKNGNAYVEKAEPKKVVKKKAAKK